MCNIIQLRIVFVNEKRKKVVKISLTTTSGCYTMSAKKNRENDRTMTETIEMEQLPGTGETKMKKMVCNMMTIAAALAFLMVMGGAIEGTIGLVKAGVLLVVFAFAAYETYQLGEMPAKAVRAKTNPAAHPKKEPVVAVQKKQSMRAA